MATEMIEQLIARYITAYNQFNIKEMLDCFHDNCNFTSMSAGNVTIQCRNKVELRQLAEQSAAYFKERMQTIKNCIFDQDKAAIEIQYRAILAKDFPNGLKADQELNLAGVSIFTFKDEKILTLVDYS